MCVQNFKFVPLPVPGIIAIEISRGGCEPQSWGRGGRRGAPFGDDTVQKSVGEFL